MAYTDNLNKTRPIYNHAYRAGTVDANRHGVKWALIAFVILAAFGIAYWFIAREIPRDINSPQTQEQVERPFNSSVLPASESTPVGQ